MEADCQSSAIIRQISRLTSGPTGAILSGERGRNTRATACAKQAAVRSEHNPHHISRNLASSEIGYCFAKTEFKTRSAILERQEVARTFLTTLQSFRTRLNPTARLVWPRFTGDEPEADIPRLDLDGLGLFEGKTGGGRKFMRTSATLSVSEGEVVRCPSPCVSCV